jgi:hypothetical protein
MTQSTALIHADPTKADERLAVEASSHLARSGPLGFMTELYARLREMQLPWWTAEQLRSAYSSSERLAWFSQRPDIRQRITTELTGLAPRAARNKSVEFQANLVDSVIDEGDISVETFESAFEPKEIVIYGPAAEIWSLFRQRMPWDDDATPHQDLIGFLLGALLADKSALDGTPRTPILSPLAVRMAIDGRVWHSRIPLDVRVAIDDARFAREKEHPNEASRVAHDLLVATPALIAASIPLSDLVNVFDLAGTAMGFEGSGKARREPRTRSSATEAKSEPKTDPPGRPEFMANPDTNADDPVTVPRRRDELEETNPWIVPANLSELSEEKRERKKR